METAPGSPKELCRIKTQVNCSILRMRQQASAGIKHCAELVRIGLATTSCTGTQAMQVLRGYAVCPTLHTIKQLCQAEGALQSALLPPAPLPAGERFAAEHERPLLPAGCQVPLQPESQLKKVGSGNRSSKLHKHKVGPPHWLSIPASGLPMCSAPLGGLPERHDRWSIYKSVC